MLLRNDVVLSVPTQLVSVALSIALSAHEKTIIIIVVRCRDDNVVPEPFPVAESVEDEPITSWINPTMKRLSGSISEITLLFD
jgi:hypothetical protein